MTLVSGMVAVSTAILSMAIVFLNHVWSLRAAQIKQGTPTQKGAPILRPRTEEELVQHVVQLNAQGVKGIRVVGARHSPTETHMTNTAVIETSQYNRILSFSTKEVTVEAGCSQGALTRYLDARGRALETVNGADAMTLGGIVSTGSWAASATPLLKLIRGLRVVQADGSVLEISPRNYNMHLLRGHFSSLGLLGVISTVTLSHVASFDILMTRELVPFASMDTCEYHKNPKVIASLYEWSVLVNHCYKVTKFKIPRANKSKESYAGPAAVDLYMANLLGLVCTVLPSIHLRLRLSYLAQLFYLRLVGTETKRGRFYDLLAPDVNIDVNIIPMKLIEVEVPEQQVSMFMAKVRQHFENNPEDAPYLPVTLDWITPDDAWISKTAACRAQGHEWVAAIGVGYMCIEKHNTASKCIDLFLKLACEMGLAVHLGKVHNQVTSSQIRSWLPKDNYANFVALRNSVDPSGLFLTEHWGQIFR